MDSKFTIPLPRVSFGKRKTRSQVFDIGTLDGRCVTTEIDVLSGCADDYKTEHAWLIAPRNQYLNEDNIWVQVVGESSHIPLQSRVTDEIKDPEGAVKEIHHNTKANDKMRQFADRANADRLTKIMWIIGAPVLGAVIIFGLKILKG
jgi:hypothetical protein